MCFGFVVFSLYPILVFSAYTDVVFMVDKSTSLNSTEYDKSLQFVHDVIQLLDIGLSHTLASLVTVSTPPTEIFDLKDHTDKSDYLQAINDLMGKGTSGDGNIKRGLNFVWENSFKTSPFNRTDPEPERVVILLSSTVTTDNAAGTVAVADKIRTDYNASIFTLGVGPGVYAQNTELRGVANDPDANFTHFVDTFDDLWCVVPIIVAKIDPSTSLSPYTNCTLKPLPPFPSATTEPLSTTTSQTSTAPTEITTITPETTSTTEQATTTPTTIAGTTTAPATIGRTTAASATTTAAVQTTIATTTTAPATIAATASTSTSMTTTAEATTGVTASTTSQASTATPSTLSLSTSSLSRTSSSTASSSATTQHASTTPTILGPAESAAATSETSAGSGTATIAGAVVAILAAAVAGAILLIFFIRKRRSSPSREEGSILAIVRQYKSAPIGPSKATFSYHRF
ncbi:uncharacterized protein [Magallana gigas]|uniref:uncharacterized protein isoform X2 n=1 Tax=Magallana gigas TaxID=29159 RepID=UPI003341D474